MIFAPRSYVAAYRYLTWLTLVLCLLTCLSAAQEQVRVEAIFNQRGVSGTIAFSQNLQGSTTISVNVTGLQTIPGVTSFPWNVHQYPFPLDAQQDPCRAGVTGDCYNPLGTNSSDAMYSDQCAADHIQCKVGDLSGRHGPLNASAPIVELTDNSLSLRGVYSIIGRSVVLFANGTRFACANIEYPSSVTGADILYVPFRSSFVGNVYFRQHANSSTASVYTDLSSTSAGLENSMGHNWHVHREPLDSVGTNCSVAGPHYNPYNVNVSSGMYADLCNPTNQTQCEVGDLSNKGAPLNAVNRVVKQLYTDTNLTLSGEGISIAGRSIVIHEGNRGPFRIACANISRYSPLEAEAVFTSPNSISGSIRFTQLSPFDHTRVEVNLMGLDMLGGYHVHIGPIGPPDLGFPTRCGGPYTGGHWNPLGVDYSVEMPVTSDGYEVGDLSGKFGSLVNKTALTETFRDPNLPLFGTFGIIGRSVVIHRNDPAGNRLVCADIVHTRPLVTFSYAVNTSNVEGSITLIQPADDPFAPTTIIVTLEVKVQLPPPVPVVTPSASVTPVQTSTLVSTPIQAMTVGLVPSPESSPAPTPTRLQASSSVGPAQSSSSSSQVEESATTTFSFSPSSPSAEQISASMANIESSAVLSSPSQPPSEQVSTSVVMAEPSAALTQPPTSQSQDISIFTDSILFPSPTMATRKRRSLPQPTFLQRKRRATTSPVPFEWSLRVGGLTDPASCGSFPIVNTSSSNPQLCSTSMPLACSVGDLMAKHGPLNLPQDIGAMLRVVFTDSNLPLSGPISPFSSDSSSPVLLVQPMNGGSLNGNEVACTGAVFVPPPTIPPATPPTTLPTTPPIGSPTTPPIGSPDTSTSVMQTETTAVVVPSSSSSVIGPIVGGVLGAVFVVVVIAVLMLVICVCKRRRSKYDVSGAAKIEMGVRTPAKPILGVPCYKALHQYEPQNEGDLALKAGDWVTLEETPYGGGWWRGSIDDRSGWFPKTYVEYVDREAEQKRKQDESFTLAAAAIMDASSSFSSHHPSLSIKRGKSDVSSEHVAGKKKGKEAQRSHTFSRREIDSTPKMVTKFDKPYLERDDIAGMVIENMTKDGSSLSGGSRPDTPKSIRNNEIITNAQADDSENSQPDNIEDFELTKAALEGGDLSDNIILHAEKYAAKYDFSGTSEIELDFSSGCVILVIEKADNGWWRGVFKGQVGWFPESYMNPMPLGKANLVSKTGDENEKRERAESAGTSADEVERPRNMDETMAAAEGGDLEASEYHALYLYQSETEGDLVFNEGDTVWVYWGQDNGWWFGAAGGKQGWFPESYVEPIIDAASTATAAEEAANKKEGGEGGNSLSDQLQAAVNQMKERSRSPTEQEKAPATSGSVADEAPEKVPPSVDEGIQSELMGKRRSLDDSKSPSTGVSENAVNDISLHHVVKEGPSMTNDPAKGSLAPPSVDEPAPPQDEVVQLPKPESKVAAADMKPIPATKDRRQTAPSKSGRRLPPPPPVAGTSPTTNVSPILLEKPEPTPADMSQSPAFSSRKTDAMPLLEVEKTKPQDISKTDINKAPKPTRSRQTMSESDNYNMSRDKPKRRTTAIDNRTKPRRRPPPPVPPALLEAAASASTNKNEESSKAVSVEETPNRIPIPPPRAKARMKKVKRPISRAIPPPPNIPLPSPPSSSLPKTATTTVASRPLASSSKAASTEQAVPPSPAPRSNGAVTSSSSDINSVPLRVRNEENIPRSTPKGPRPPPPARISSLMPSAVVVPVAPQRSKKPEELEEVKEAVAVAVRKSSANSKTPPKRPPPPRPGNAPALGSSSSKKYSKPPNSSPPTLPTTRPLDKRTSDTSETGASISPRGSRLMGSLKRMVKRDSKKSGPKDSVAKEEPVAKVTKPQRPSHPPSPLLKNKATDKVHSPSASQKKVESIAQSPPSEGDSPVPKPRTKKPSKSQSDCDIPLSSINHVSEKDITVSKQQPPKRPSHPPNTSPQLPKKVSAEPPPKLAKVAEANKPKLDKPASASASNQPPSRPVRVHISASTKDTSKTSASNPPPQRPVRTSASASSKDTSKTSASNPPPQRPVRTSASASTKDTSKTSASNPPPQRPVRTSSVLTKDTKETSPLASSENHRRSTNIPDKPPPPVTVTSKSVQKPKPPLAPKLSTPSPKPDTATDTFKMPGNSKLNAKNGNDTSHLVSEPKVHEQVNDDRSSSPESPPANFYRAIKAYEAKSSAELSFVEGDTLMFIDKRDKGFYYGMKDDGNTGLFPVSSVAPFLKK